MTAARLAIAGGSCRSCRFFDGGALPLEARLPLIAALSSAHGSSRSDDGLCLHHDRFVRASATCPVHCADAMA